MEGTTRICSECWAHRVDPESQRPAARAFRAVEPAKLLLIDASIGQRAVLQRILVAHGFSVLACADLSKAAPKIATQRFDYAVVELRLPGRNGLGLVRSLREALPQVRIVVVTDADSFATVVLALRAGADGFVAKPVDEGELIDALLDQAPPLPPVPQTP
jgi:two-component system response regulator RegA